MRFASRSGHGAHLRAAGLAQILAADVVTVDAGYVYRFRVVGDDWLGLGLDLGGGLSAGSADDVTSSFGSGGVDGPRPNGARVGGYAEVSLDFRAYGFLIGIGASYRMLFPTEQSSTPDNVLEAHLTLGFGFVL